MPTSLLFLGDLGGGEIMLIMVVILIFFGANKIPELARGLGKGIREFKDASTEIRKEFEGHGLPAPPPQAPVAQWPYAAPYAAPTTKHAAASSSPAWRLLRNRASGSLSTAMRTPECKHFLRP